MRIYTTKEAAEALGASRQTIYDNCRKHGIGQRHGAAYILTQEDVDRLDKILQRRPGRRPKSIEDSLKKDQ